jgi:hypothetical protein
MTIVAIIAGAVAAVVAGLAFAFLPLKMMLDVMAKNVAVPVRNFIQRQRDRRSVSRGTPDRRNL